MADKVLAVPVVIVVVAMALLAGCLSSPSSDSTEDGALGQSNASRGLNGQASDEEGNPSDDDVDNESYLEILVEEGRTTGAGVESENPVNEVNHCVAGGCDNRTQFNVSEAVVGLVAELEWTSSSALEEEFEFDVSWFDFGNETWIQVSTEGTSPLRIVVEDFDPQPEGEVHAVARPKLVTLAESRIYASQGQDITFYLSLFHNMTVDAGHSALS